MSPARTSRQSVLAPACREFVQLFFRIHPSAQPGQYDHHVDAAFEAGSDLDRFVKAELDQINRTMVAHADPRVWASFLDRPLPALAAIAPAWSLFDDVPDLEWPRRAQRIHAAIEARAKTRGIGVAQATKIRHIKRPQLIPVIDSYVAHTLNVSPPSESTSLEQGMAAIGPFRELGLPQREALAGIAEHLASGRCVTFPPSDVRVVDAVLWAWPDTRYQTLYHRIKAWSS